MNFDPRMEPFLELCSSVEEKRVRVESIETENQKDVKAKKSFITADQPNHDKQWCALGCISEIEFSQLRSNCCLDLADL